VIEGLMDACDAAGDVVACLDAAPDCSLSDCALSDCAFADCAFVDCDPGCA
jgi:hypothetical protein